MKRTVPTLRFSIRKPRQVGLSLFPPRKPLLRMSDLHRQAIGYLMPYWAMSDLPPTPEAVGHQPETIRFHARFLHSGRRSVLRSVI
jgi:hypothetical protein